VCDIDMLNVLI